MTDHPTPLAGDDVPPPPPPPPAPPARRGRIAAAVAGVALVVGGGAFAISSLTSADGADSPSAAVEQLFRAAADEDVLGVLESLDPDERDVATDPLVDVVTHLQDLDVLDDGFTLDGVPGFDLEFDDLTFETHELGDDLARVEVTGGTASASFLPDELPLGGVLEELLGGSDVTDLAEPERSEGPMEGLFLVARRSGDGWYVSLGYTIAEMARVRAGLPEPTDADAIAPLGADSPAAAVEAMLQAALDGDLRTVIARLSPGEFGALQRYAGLFLDESDLVVDDLDDVVDLRLDSVDLDDDRDGRRATVRIHGFALTAAFVEGPEVAIVVEDGCIEIDGDLSEFDIPTGDEFWAEVGLPDPTREPVCVDDLLEGAEAFGLGGSTGEPSASPDLGITTLQVDGDWYVAPLGTAFDALAAFIQTIDRDTIEAFGDALGAFGALDDLAGG